MINKIIEVIEDVYEKTSWISRKIKKGLILIILFLMMIVSGLYFLHYITEKNTKEFGNAIKQIENKEIPSESEKTR
jgi:hypothetical protein